jgi:hypothetical protein
VFKRVVAVPCRRPFSIAERAGYHSLQHVLHCRLPFQRCALRASPS